MPMPAFPQTADQQDDWKDIAPAAATSEADDWKDVVAAPATETAPATPEEVRYSAPGQGIQSFTKGSAQEQDFLKRFPQAKVVPHPRNPSSTGPLVTTPMPLPPSTPTNTPAEVAAQSGKDVKTLENTVGETLPVLGAAATSLAANPEVGWVAGTGLNMLGAAGGRAAQQIYNRATGAGKVPQTGLDAAKDIAVTGTTYGAADLALKGVTGLTGMILRNYFPEIHEAIGQMSDALIRAVPDSAPNETAAIGYRQNLEEAAPDLQKIAKRSLATRTGVFDPAAPGGFFSTEYRPTNLWKDTNSYMQSMFQNEISPMVQAADQGGAQVRLANAQFPDDVDAVQRAMKKLSTIPDYDEGTHHIAARVAANPTDPISMHDAEILIRAVNQQMRAYQRASGSAAATMAATQRMTPVFEHVDKLLGDAADREMAGLGQPGIRGYERRYAALADFRENLGKILAPTERQRLGLAPTTYVNPKGVGSRFYLKLGQNPGRQIEYAMQQLARADDIPTGAIGPQPLPGIPRVVQPGGPGGGAAGGGGGGGAAGGGAAPPSAPRTGLPPAPPAQLSPAPQQPQLPMVGHPSAPAVSKIDQVADYLVSKGMDRVQAEEHARRLIEATSNVPGYTPIERTHAHMMMNLYGLGAPAQ